MYHRPNAGRSSQTHMKKGVTHEKKLQAVGLFLQGAPVPASTIVVSYSIIFQLVEFRPALPAVGAPIERDFHP